MIGMLLAVQAAAAEPAQPTEPPACTEYRQAISEMMLLGPNVVLFASGKKPKVSSDGQRLLRAREELAQAMKANAPNLDHVERLMREELRLREIVSGRLSAAKVGCDVALLRQLQGAKLREALDILRPRTSAEIEERRRSTRIPPPPIARPAPPR